MPLPQKRAFDCDGDSLIAENDQQTSDCAEEKGTTGIRKEENKIIPCSSAIITNTEIFSNVIPSEAISEGDKTSGFETMNMASPSEVLQKTSNIALQEHMNGTVIPAIDTSASEADEMQRRKIALLASIHSISQQDGQTETSISSNHHNEETTPQCQIPQLESQNFQEISYHSKHAKYKNGPFNRNKNNFNELWYQDYYDPSFLYNPWESLEKANGLQSTNNWMERDS
ncbi:hypothetical protein GcC1_083011 [Golovinomyces cichoracearum]|uniref:Uncharacterized protein n=1 Tax=Golovinomyces cichoracearum TaxID=62708 RepID=A0A420IJ83_9PEZI|nr:hypothetical protein GcC1_083011 [Golovinomyces cichoracearum]